jgi:hypothetical protein
MEDYLVEEIIDILGYEMWRKVGAFGESIDNALRLPIEVNMWWTIEPKSSYHGLPTVSLSRGLDRSYNGKFWVHSEVIAHQRGNSIIEAICKAWLEWKNSITP